MFKLIQFVLAALLAVLLYLLPFSEDGINTLCILLILVFGVPHGAIDHKIHLSLTREKNSAQYITLYVLLAIGYLVWWIFMPLKAFLTFVILSAYHFGQELIEDLSPQKKLPVTYLLWGGIILINPILFHFDEIRFYLNDLSGVQLAPLNKDSATYIILGITSMTVLDLIRLVVTGVIVRTAAWRLFSFACFISVIYAVLPFIAAFTVYFVLFHSTNALRHQYQWFRKLNASYNLIKFVKDLSAFSLAAFFGIAFILWFFEPQSWTAIFAYFFVFISLLTLPHAILFDQLYSNKRLV